MWSSSSPNSFHFLCSGRLTQDTTYVSVATNILTSNVCILKYFINSSLIRYAQNERYSSTKDNATYIALAGARFLGQDRSNHWTARSEDLVMDDIAFINMCHRGPIKIGC